MEKFQIKQLQHHAWDKKLPQRVGGKDINCDIFPAYLSFSPWILIFEKFHDKQLHLHRIWDKNTASRSC